MRGVAMKGFVQDIEGLAAKNEEFRRVLYTAQHCQLVLMALKPGEEIGAEVHTLDQFFRMVLLWREMLLAAILQRSKTMKLSMIATLGCLLAGLVLCDVAGSYHSYLLTVQQLQANLSKAGSTTRRCSGRSLSVSCRWNGCSDENTS